MIKVHIGQHRDTDYVIHDGRRVLVCPSIMFNKGSSLAPIRVSVNGVSGELNLMHKADGGFAYKLVVPEGPYKGFSRTVVFGEVLSWKMRISLNSSMPFITTKPPVNVGVVL